MIFFNDDQFDDNSGSNGEGNDEEIKKVFSKAKKDESKRDDEELEKKPQDEEGYIVESQLIDDETANLAPRMISKEMRESFLEYAMSVIVARALPDARDGLKPVHRRIIYGMYELGITANSSYKKSARIVGDVLGKYHPHGDKAVYDSMVRMAQDFSLRYPLVDGHGNYGSVDGDGAAAMRYTEARMSSISMLLVDSVRKNTVDFVDNYDVTEKEPLVLPAKFPNFLVSGANGIAVGMATSVPPHNLREIIDAVVMLAKNRDVTLDELLNVVNGPDFPTGATIIGKSGIFSAYQTGRGSVLIRSKTTIEELKNNRQRIIVTEIPYQVNKARLITKIADLVKQKVIQGISNLRDETSRRGTRIVIEIKSNHNPDIVLNKLFKHSDLQKSYSINLLALVNGEPKTLTLKDALNVYLEHQIEIYSREISFDLHKAEARAEILRGLKIAIANMDSIIELIKNASDESSAQVQLSKKYELSERQSKAVVDMRLGRLTKLATSKIDEEMNVLLPRIAEYNLLLGNREKLVEHIVEKLQEIKAKFGDDRRTDVVEGSGSIDDESLITKKDIAITMSNNGYVKRIALEEYQTQNRGGVGFKAMNTYEDDDVAKLIVTNTHIDLLLFTNLGRVYRIRAHQIPELSKQAKGTPFLNLIDLNKNEVVVAILPIDEYNDETYLVTVSKGGTIKKTSVLEYANINRNGKKALSLKENDFLLNALIATNDDEIVIGATNGKAVRFDIKDIRSMGRTAAGVRGIKLDKGDEVVGISIAKGEFVFAIGANGFGKKTPISDYRKTNRGAKGVKTIEQSKAGKLRFVEVVDGNEEVIVATKKGIIIRLSLERVSTSSRGTKGVKLITLQDKNFINSVAVINLKKNAETQEILISKEELKND